MNYNQTESPEYQILATRVELLFDCLWYCSRYQEAKRRSIFTISERILINQERGALMSQQTAMLYPNEDNPVREFTVPNYLEDKIQFIKNKV